MLAGIREFLIITTPNDIDAFKNLLGDGSKWGIDIIYKVQKTPDGIASALILGEEFLNNSPSALILGDNLFHGENLGKNLENANKDNDYSTVFAYKVSDPERYGVLEFNQSGGIKSIEEKPKNPKTKYAITGLYFYDKDAPKKCKTLKPSKRGELEITDLNKLYLQEKKLKVSVIGRGMTWLDTGTFDSLHQASSFIRTLEKRQGQKVCSPEEISWRLNLISNSDLEILAKDQEKSGYGKYLLDLLNDKSHFLNN
tara:strand:+ start:29 stop:793 length:765 start_codon:yes stop_codon:yes gene_type:complete